MYLILKLYFRAANISMTRMLVPSDSRDMYNLFGT